MLRLLSPGVLVLRVYLVRSVILLVVRLVVAALLHGQFRDAGAVAYAMRGQRRRWQEARLDEWDTAVTVARPDGVDPRAARRPSARTRLRQTWRMPPLATLERPSWSRGRRLGMLALRAYLVVAVLLLVVKATELVLGH